MKDTSDSELMRQVRDGRVAALATLFERHHARIYRYCARMLGNRAMAEDLVQDVFMRMLQYKSTFKDDSDFVPWMFGIARNGCLKQMRRTPVENADESRLEAALHAAPESRADSDPAEDQQGEILQQALLKLPAERREVLLLSRFEFKTYEEIAAVQGCSVGAVKVRAHRAIKELRAVYLKMTGGVAI